MGPIKYTNLRLTRPVDSNSQWLAMWLQLQTIKVIPQTMSISALNAAGEEITTWNLAGVIPRKWTGPTLDIMGNAIATEIARGDLPGDHRLRCARRGAQPAR